jgi:hypothetical protein
MVTTTTQWVFVGVRPATYAATVPAMTLDAVVHGNKRRFTAATHLRSSVPSPPG